MWSENSLRQIPAAVSCAVQDEDGPRIVYEGMFCGDGQVFALMQKTSILVIKYCDTDFVQSLELWNDAFVNGNTLENTIVNINKNYWIEYKYIYLFNKLQ